MLGKVQVNKLNLLQGELTDVECFFLFVGRGAGKNEDTVLTVNTNTDLDDVLGTQDSLLKTQVKAARANAGQNWFAAILPLAAETQWSKGVDLVMEQMNVEGIAVTDPVAGSADVEAMQAKAEEIMGRYMRPVFFIPTNAAIDPATESWSAYQARVKALYADLACDQVNPVATVWHDDQGAYCGRLCNRSVTVADSPMRVMTGPIVGIRSTKPVDTDGRPVDMGILSDLDKARITVPQWYPDYPGVYFGDGNVLDVPGGDYQVVENLRVVQKGMRKVYPLAVAKIGDRKLNSTPSSLAYHENYFTRPLREMSKSTEIMGIVFPGEIKPPKDGSIVIQWTTKTKVEIYMSVQPYNCPKSITVNLLLDLSNAAE